MNRILSLIGVVLVVGCGPEPRDIGTLQELDGLYMNPVDGQPYSGPVFGMKFFQQFQQPGAVRTLTGSLKDGVLDGPIETYYENGQLRWKGARKCGVDDGAFELYHENGELSQKGAHNNGMVWIDHFGFGIGPDWAMGEDPSEWGSQAQC